MMKTYLALTITALVAVGAVACDKKEDAAGTTAANQAASSTPAAPATSAATPKAAAAPAAGSPKIGDSCKGISASDGKLGCDGNKIIFCSSYSQYEWKQQRECPAGQNCAMNADGKSATCK